MTHELKTWPEYYDAVVSGQKTFEVRKSDREFSAGDTLFLQCYDPETAAYMGQQIEVKVTYILRGGAFGVQDGYVVMGIRIIN